MTETQNNDGTEEPRAAAGDAGSGKGLNRSFADRWGIPMVSSAIAVTALAAATIVGIVTRTGAYRAEADSLWSAIEVLRRDMVEADEARGPGRGVPSDGAARRGTAAAGSGRAGSLTAEYYRMHRAYAECTLGPGDDIYDYALIANRLLASTPTGYIEAVDRTVSSYEEKCGGPPPARPERPGRLMSEIDRIRGLYLACALDDRAAMIDFAQLESRFTARNMPAARLDDVQDIVERYDERCTGR